MKIFGMVLVASIALVVWDESFYRGQYRYEIHKMGKRIIAAFQVR
jgi:hypothetical protein